MRTQSQNQLRARRPLGWRAFSLLEVTAVVAVIGIVSLAAISRLGNDSLTNLSAEGYARTLQSDLQQVRQRTAATGDNHFLRVTYDGSSISSYVMWRRASGGDVIVDSARTTPVGLVVTSTHADLEFDFDGSSLALYTVTIVGPSRSWQVTTVPATGLCQVFDITP
ncbi:pilus assembly FimT family protein [Adhaeretor mobilis]|uniref:Prepilin-type N-terminal cleavage/methylation domain-containing protein n=1 Tax=Adhaeretor mobilis TaxID=1930276 RepID=A0A517MWV5_9BACT|nr:type II secretion system protein [Adhaeretor mobilis]QDS99358.1 hypothetical protein HG15A2_26810 [Adhaeretor mobilis]